MKHMPFTQKVVTLLAQRGSIAHTDIPTITEAFQRSAHENFEFFLLDEGIVDREDLLPVLAHYYQVPAFDVEGYFFDHMLLRQLPKEVLHQCRVIPLEVEDNTLFMVANEPDREDLLPAIGNYVSYDIQFYVGIAQDIIDAVEDFYDKALTEVSNDESDIYREIAEEKEEELTTEEQAGMYPIEDINDISDENT